jgi:hypothetical protein
MSRKTAGMNTQEDLVKRYQAVLRELVYSQPESGEIRNSYQEWVDLSEEIDDLRELWNLAIAALEDKK